MKEPGKTGDALANLDEHEKRRLLVTLRERELLRCAKDPAHFIFKHVRTRDEHDLASPTKLFPDKGYIRYVLDQWHNGPSIQYVAKSRQLMVSWLMCAYAIWMARFHPNALVLFQSKKDEDAAKMVFIQDASQARCSFMEANLPEWLQICRTASGWAQITRKLWSYGTLVYPNGARIEAIPQGPTQIEGRVPSLFLNDEASLQEMWAAAQAAARPCLTGAKGITVGTMRLPSDFGEEISPSWHVDPDGAAPGIAHFQSASGVPGLRIHYTADPDKSPATENGRQFVAELSSGYPGGMSGHLWQQHMEINPTARAGTRCITNWDQIRDKIVIEPIPLEAQVGWRYYSGLDWGARNHAVWHIYGLDLDQNLYLIHELSVPGNQIGGIQGMCALMRPQPLFRRVNGKIWSDPSLWNKDQNVTGGLVSKARLFQMEGVRLLPAKLKGQDADEIALERLNNHYWALPDDPGEFQPKFFIFDTCENTIRYWPQLRYEEWTEGMASDRAHKEKMRDVHTDQWDAFKYFLCSVLPRTGELQSKPPPGSFAAVRAQIIAAKRSNRGTRELR